MAEEIRKAEDERAFKLLDDIAFAHRHRVRNHVHGLGSCEWCGETVRVDSDDECPMFIASEVMES